MLQGLQKTTEVNKTDDVVMLLLEEQQQAQQNGHAMGLTVVFVERKVWIAAMCTLCACEGWQTQQGAVHAWLADVTCCGPPLRR